MRRPLGLCLRFTALALVGAGSVISYWKLSHRPPMLWLAATHVVLPRSRVHETHPIAVAIENRGGAVLRLKIAGVTCGCTELHLEKANLLPGERTVLKGTIRAKTSFGSYSSRVGLASNDPKMPFTEIVLTGSVDPYVTVAPERVTLRPDIYYRKPAVSPVRVRNDDDKLVAFSVEVKGIHVECSQPKFTLGPTETFVLDISCPAKLIQRQEGQIILHTDHDIQPVVRVPVEIAPAWGLEMHPARLRLGVIAHSELLTKRFTLFLRGRLAERAHIVSVTPPPFLETKGAASNPTPAGTAVDLAFSPTCPRGTLSGDVILTVKLSKHPIEIAKVIVPVDAIVH